MKIIPAIDIIDGKCVRLTKGDYTTRKIYSNNPVDVAKQFEDFGMKYLHLVDLDGAKNGRVINYKILEKIAQETSLEIDFGGGLKTENDIDLVLNSGAKQITLGSIAVNNVEFCLQLIEQLGDEKIILGADCENRKVKISGWQEESKFDVVDFIKMYADNGIKSVICTDISKDGMLMGASEELYTDILYQSKIQLIASGGIANVADLYKMKEIGCSGSIIGKAIYEEKISLIELRNFIENA